MKIQNFLIALLFVLSPLAISDAGADHGGDDAEHCTDVGGAFDPAACVTQAAPPPDEANCGPAGGDPLYDAACALVFSLDQAAPQLTVVPGDPDGDGEADDLDNDGRIDTAEVRLTIPETCVPLGPVGSICSTGDWAFVQIDFFYTPPDEHYGDAAGLPTDYQDGTNFDVLVTGVMLYDPYAGLAVLEEGTSYRLTNHYGIPRDAIGGSTLPYTGLYIPDFDSADGYGRCVVCIQPETLRLGVNAGPDTHDGVNGQADSVGLLKVASAQSFILDLDVLSPADGSGVLDTIKEAEDAFGFKDDTPTLALVGLGGQARSEFNFPDARPFDPSFMHIKWPGDRGEPIDLFGAYTKYSNLDDDYDTDQDEMLCTGQPTNPTNPMAYCNDWDGDGTPNHLDAQPASPDVEVTLEFTTVPNPDGEEAPFVPDFTIECLGDATDMILEISKDNGATWSSLEGHQNNNELPATCADRLLGNDRSYTTSSEDDINVLSRLRVVNLNGASFYSNEVSFLLLGNTAPTGTYEVFCVNPEEPGPTDNHDDDDCSNGAHTARKLSYLHRLTMASLGDAAEIAAGQSLRVELHDGWDRNGDANGIAAPTLSHQGDGVYEYTETDSDFFYAEGDPRNVFVILTDGGGQSTSPDPITINVPERMETAPILSHAQADDVAELEDGSMEIRVGVSDPDNHYVGDIDVTLFWRQSDGEYTEASMTPLACSGASVQWADEDLLNCPTEFDTGVESASGVGFVATIAPQAGDVEYYFHANNPDAEDNTWDEQETFLPASTGTYTTTSTGGPTVPGGQGIPDPLDYLIGDCKLLVDLTAALGGDPMCARNFDPENYGVTLPGDEIDPHDTDGDGDTENSNQQIDIVERFFFYYNVDEATADPNDDLSGDSGVTLHVWKNRGVQEPERKDLSIRVGDVIGTELDEVLVVELGTRPTGDDPYLVYCVVSNDGQNVLYGNEDSFDHETGCGERIPDVWGNVNNVIDIAYGTAAAVIFGGCGESTLPSNPCPSPVTFNDEDNDFIPESVDLWLPDPATCGPKVANEETCDPEDDVITETIPLDGVPDPDPNSLCEDPDTQTFPDCVGGTGAPDADGDGVADDADDCDNTPEGEAVDEKGCSESQGGNPPVAEPCEGTEDPVMGECLPTNELPTDPNQLCDDPEGQTFPECVAGEPDPNQLCDDPEGQTFPECLAGEPDPNQLCDDPTTQEFPVCIVDPSAVDGNGNGMPDALEPTFEPSCYDYASQPVYFCQHGLGNGVGGVVYGEDWNGYAIIVLGVPVML